MCVGGSSLPPIHQLSLGRGRGWHPGVGVPWGVDNRVTEVDFRELEDGRGRVAGHCGHAGGGGGNETSTCYPVFFSRVRKKLLKNGGG